MAGSGPNQEESMMSQRQDHFLNFERRRSWEVSVHTTHTSRSQSRGGSHVSYEENTRAMQLEIDHLRKELCRERRRRTLSNSGSSSDDGRDGSYKPRSRTPPNESFSCDENSPHEHKDKGSSCKGLRNDIMSKALNQIFGSPFTHRIEGGKLPKRFAQPIFTMYNSPIDLVEHVSHFNQMMVVHSKNKALMCKVFPFNLGPMAMRWFDGLREGSISSFKELTKAFRAKFVTCSRVPQSLDSLLPMTM